MMNDINCGAFTSYHKEIPKEILEFFYQTTKDIVGVGYDPISYATQVVAGTNYSFFCNAKPVYPHAIEYAVLIEIYRPLKGEPHITKIIKVH
ncbi:hypothetical protein K4L44_03015 [Halosquirtibacter laminarini]|uniref:Uncharacterized protein n=1 Tax=Halosquirtibacter laminarini TaxID=3374600 RepID=A0AC61NGS4_9BACT|nr:hypothetical protein K4L44_03015 [Prolixibacteraceae bacterium]